MGNPEGQKHVLPQTLIITTCLAFTNNGKMEHLCMMEELHMELHRITNCPYTPSLKVPKDLALSALSVSRASFFLTQL